MPKDIRQGQLHSHRCVVEDDVAAMTELAVDAYGRLDVVFNNAGIGGAFGPITELG